MRSLPCTRPLEHPAHGTCALVLRRPPVDGWERFTAILSGRTGVLALCECACHDPRLEHPALIPTD